MTISDGASTRVNGAEVVPWAPKLVLHIEGFPPMCNVTIDWPRESGAWRRTIEDELECSLRTMAAPKSHVANWLSWASAAIFLALFLLTVAMQILIQRSEGL
jgi:hypothetical protein